MAVIPSEVNKRLSSYVYVANGRILKSNFFETDFVIKTNDKKSRRFDPSSAS